LLVGLSIAQVIATLQVRQSNLALHAKMKAVLSAGFLSVPTGKALESLKAFGSAVWGGVFFTLSVGAILVLASLVASRLIQVNRRREGFYRHIPLIIWVSLIVLINVHDVGLFVNLYVWLIPPIVYYCSRRWSPVELNWQNIAAQSMPVILLAALWFTQYDRHMFIDIRDRLLLSNPVGEQINNFYYRYTLYPAEAFKAPSQKTINTSFIKNEVKNPQRQTITMALVRYDWLPVASEQEADWIIEQLQNRLRFIQADRVVTESSLVELVSQTGDVLKRSSDRVDRYRHFRLICFYGLLFGFPILLYMGLFTLVRILCRLFVDTDKSLWAASAICLLLGTIVWGYFQYGRVDAAAKEALTSSVTQKSWQTQIAVLRQIRSKGLDVMRVQAYEGLKTSTRIPVRYWLVETLSTSKHPEAFEELMFFLEDPSLNVRTRACQALGRRGERQAIPVLMKQMNRSDEWYLQWYAYNALKALGWNQTASD
jgi:hypothetical protein